MLGYRLSSLLALAVGSVGVLAQHNAHVGPLTSLSTKSHLCNVLNYGAVADNSTDIGTALTSAFENCVLKNSGSTLYVPPGTYALKSSVRFDSGSKWAMRLDGLIEASYKGTISGNMIVFSNNNDLEVYSSNAKGAIQGNGWVWRTKDGLTASKPRIMRFLTCTNFSVHDILLVDAPAFHLVLDNSVNYEAYYITIRGPHIGGSDGIDASGSNYYLHDIQVSNRDECVSVKSPSKDATIARFRCNQSGGMSIGSLQTDAAVENIIFDTIDSYQSTQGLMIKTFPSAVGTNAGYVKNVVASNFRLYDNTYSAYIQQYWENTITPDGAGVQISNVTFENWSGSNENGYERGWAIMQGSKYAVPYDITVKNFDMFSENSGSEQNKCSNAYGTGACLKTPKATGTYPAYAEVTEVINSAPSGWKSPGTPSWAVGAYPVYAKIPVYSPVPSYPLKF